MRGRGFDCRRSLAGRLDGRETTASYCSATALGLQAISSHSVCPFPKWAAHSFAAGVQRLVKHAWPKQPPKKEHGLVQ